MSRPVIRRIVLQVDETHLEMAREVTPPTRRSVAAAIIVNPFAGSFVDDLSALFDIGEYLGQELGDRAVAALGVTPERIESYGKAAMVGYDGELEHAAAVLHPQLGRGLRNAVGGGKALVPSSKKYGGPGQALDIPLGHKDAAYVRSHFDGVEIWLPDAPRPNELVVAVAVSDSGRPHPRVGGLTVEEVTGEDGLR